LLSLAGVEQWRHLDTLASQSLLRLAGYHRPPMSGSEGTLAGAATPAIAKRRVAAAGPEV